MKTLIKHGLLVLTEGCTHGDLLIDGDKIAAIGDDIRDPKADVYDAEGCMVFPGFIDAHTHLDMQTAACHTADDFHSGSRAALLGGTTTVLDFATQTRGDSLSGALTEWHGLAESRSFCDYGFHMAITDWQPRVADELYRMVNQGITSFKVYLAYDSLRLPDRAIYEICRRLRLLGGLLMLHSENGDLVNCLAAELAAEGRLEPEAHALSRPPFVEAEAVSRALAIAEAAQTVPYIVHLSSSRALDVAREARRRGQKLWLESCPQYLFLADTLYQQEFNEAAKYVCSPPLRSPADNLALWQAAINGEIDVIATDHCAFNLAGQKELGRGDFRLIPSGLPGVEQRPLLLYSRGVAEGQISPEHLAALCAENPARIFGLYPRKGVLREGSDADIVIIEPDSPYAINAKNQHQQVDYTPFAGIELSARLRAVWLRGALAAEDGRLFTEQPRGVFLSRGPSAGV